MLAWLGCCLAHLSYSVRTVRLASSLFMLATQTLAGQEMKSKQEAAVQRRHLRGVEKWDHGKKYTDFMPEGQSGSTSR